MKKFITLLCLIIIACNFGIAQSNKEFHEIKVGEFTELKVSDNINVVYSNNPDSLGFAHFYVDKSLVNAIMFNNNNKGTLTVRVETSAVNNPNLPTIYVYSEFLQSAKNEADSTIRIAKIAPIPELKLQTSANGKIIAHNVNATTLSASIATGKGMLIVGGKCQKAQFKLVGTGEIQADQLTSGDVFCRLLGTGTIGCNVSGVLTIKGSGTGKVYYSGTPTEIKTNTLGPIKAISIDEVQ